MKKNFFSRESTFNRSTNKTNFKFSIKRFTNDDYDNKSARKFLNTSKITNAEVANVESTFEIGNVQSTSKNEASLLKKTIDLSTMLSPVKFHSSKLTIEGSPMIKQSLLLNSPSPRKSMKLSNACRNVGFLLKTPEKESSEENEPPTIEFKEEPLLNEEKKAKKKYKRKTSTLSNVNNNFVRINLRRKTYAPKSRPCFKKKWKKVKHSKHK